MPSISEIVARAEQIAAGRGTDPHKSPVIDAGMTVEALYPHALRYAICKDLSSGGNSQNYIRTHSITLTAGAGPLPDSVLREFLCSSFIPADLYAAWIPYPDYIRQRYNNLATYYSNNGAVLYYSGVGASVGLSAPSLPEPPVDATTNITGISAKLVDDVITIIASALLGDIPLPRLLE